jgi:alpha-L-rhamnosidase
MVRIGSPFAVLYLYEAFEKLGLEDRILQDIYKNYLPMLESGATTVWESFPTGTTGSGGFPTRSHCHAWSSAPSYFLNRIVLGVKSTSPGAATVQLSPRLSGLTWARGVVATVRGPIRVAWRLAEPNKVEVTCTAPEGVKVQFALNDSLAGKEILLNGKEP